MTKSEWSGWVQAIGSILAILASALVIWWQVRKQHRLQVSAARQAGLGDELRRVEGFIQLAQLGYTGLHHAALSLADFANAVEFQDTQRYKLSFDLIGQSLSAVDVSLMSTASLDLATRATVRDFHGALEIYDQAFSLSGVEAFAIRRATHDSMMGKIGSITYNLRILQLRAAQVREELGLPLESWHEAVLKQSSPEPLSNPSTTCAD
jgi:hypothetical protein